MIRLLVMSLAALAATSAPAQAGNWKHQHSKLEVPDQLAGLALLDVRDSENNGLDVSLNFWDSERGENITLYVFRNVSGDVPVWYDRASAILALQPKFANAVAVAPPASFVPPGQGSASGLKQIFAESGGDWKSTALALMPMGEWYVKFRLSSKTRTVDELAARLEQSLAAIKWPTKLAAQPVAVPVAACSAPLTYAGKAEIAETNVAAGLMAALMVSAANSGDRKSKDKDKGEAESPTIWCRDPKVVKDSNQFPFGAVYRRNNQTDDYLLTVADSGRAMAIGRNGIAELVKEDDKPVSPRWTPRLILLNRTIVYQDFASLAPPEQLLSLLQTGKTVSSVNTFGDKRTISLTPDAAK